MCQRIRIRNTIQKKHLWFIWGRPPKKKGWVGPRPKSTNIKAYPAYEVFGRGDRSVELSQGTSAVPNATVLRITGVLNETGNPVIPPSLSGNDGKYVLIGNPYASAINVISALSRATGVTKTTFTVMDPKFNN